MVKKSPRNETFSFIHSGIKFPLDPDMITEDHIQIEDIIYHLSMLNRWNGATNRPFSVLEHCLYCDELVQEEYGDKTHLRLLALFHDSHESVTGDYPSPLKLLCPKIKEFQDKYDEMLFKKLDMWPISIGNTSAMRRIDAKAKLGEAREFMVASVFVELARDKSISLPHNSPLGCSYGEKRDWASQRFVNIFSILMDRKRKESC